MVANDNCYVRDCRGKIEKGDFGAVGEWVEDFSSASTASASADGGSGRGSGSAGTVKLLRPSRGKKNSISTSTSTSNSNSNEELEEDLEEDLELERSNAVYIKAIPLPLPPTQQQNHHQQQKIQIQISARSDVHSQQKLSEMLKVLNEIWEKMGREWLSTGPATGMGMVGRGENKRKISMAEGFFWNVFFWGGGDWDWDFRLAYLRPYFWLHCYMSSYMSF